MAECLLGKPVADQIMSGLMLRTQTPNLAVVRIGEREDDLSYENALRTRCASSGIGFIPCVLPADVAEEDILCCIDSLNQNDSISGILLFQPLPQSCVNDASKIRNAICSSKDVDGITDASLSGVFLNRRDSFAPCTAEACMELLRYYRIPVSGAETVIIGRSFVVGRPLSAMLLQQNATVTVCHTKTTDLEAVCKRADILIAAAGVPMLIGKQHVRPGQVVLDVGIHTLSDGCMCGDVDADAVSSVVRALTPVPRGIGTVTTAVLLKHIIQACGRIRDKA